MRPVVRSHCNAAFNFADADLRGVCVIMIVLQTGLLLVWAQHMSSDFGSGHFMAVLAVDLGLVVWNHDCGFLVTCFGLGENEDLKLPI